MAGGVRKIFSKEAHLQRKEKLQKEAVTGYFDELSEVRAGAVPAVADRPSAPADSRPFPALAAKAVSGAMVQLHETFPRHGATLVLVGFRESAAEQCREWRAAYEAWIGENALAPRVVCYQVRVAVLRARTCIAMAER